jgi:hypothetical protein
VRALLCCLLALAPAGAAAQDLFELEVFEYDGVRPGGYEVAFHANLMSRGGAPPTSVAGNHRPAHLSIEVTRGLTERLEMAGFLQTAPFGSTGSTRFAGGHVRSKIRFGELPRVPLRVAASAEYAFNRSAFDDELQTFEVRTIVEYAKGRLALVANPSVELVTHGGDAGLEPVFDVSARAAWALATRLTLAADYFSAAATTRHLQPEPSAHHLLFGGIDLDLGSGWELGLSAGHCVTSAEPWVARSMIGRSF